jgi:uncharacterized membrane protein (UPF0127 family)
MLFVFDSDVASAFWMKGMRFPLDFIWISRECTVSDVTAVVPAPGPDTPDSQLLTYRSAAPAAYNFEVNAGEAEQHGVRVGDPVRFVGMSEETRGACQ